MTLRRRFQQGFAAVAAIFLVVVLAALGGYMLAFSNTQQLTGAQDLLGTRAYWAARGGLEWAVSAAEAASACPSPATLSLQGFSVAVACAQSTYTEGGSSIKLLRFDSVASSGSPGGAGYVERSVSASMELP